LENSRDANRPNDITPAQAADQAAASPRGWLIRNGPYLILLALLVVVFRYYFGFDLDDLKNVGIAALGLGLVIFIHELGHFLVAKWCDVHVETFSIGFGPPLPGCCFKWGETTYMIALFPLGGYVKMVGEGAENDENDTDPRSFKNKPVWQRMAIISAGVTMNLILAFLCFVFVFMAHGDEQTPSVIGSVEPGGPAWKLGVRNGQVIYWIDNKGPRPSFQDELTPTVMNSREGEALRFVYGPPNASEADMVQTTIVPQRGEADLRPIIGILSPPQLTLLSARDRKAEGKPVILTSAAAAAEPPFQFEDTIVASSFDPAHPDELKDLPPDPRNPEHRDYFEFDKRLRDLAGQAMRIQVRRKDSGELVTIRVPAAYHYVLGLRMRMGKIIAVRDHSPAEAAGVQPEDIIDQVEVTDGPTKVRYVTSRTGAKDVIEKDLDPVRLAFELNQWAARQQGERDVILTVLRKNPPPNHNERQQVKLTLHWDDSWKYNQEGLSGQSWTLSVPGLGIAFRVETTVADVLPNSPADGKLRKGDVIKAWRVQVAGKKVGDDPRMTEWYDLRADQWANVTNSLQTTDYKKVEFRIERDQAEVELTAEEDKDWPLVHRGLLFLADIRLVKAASLGQAFGLGVEKTLNFINQIYGNLRSLARGRISYKVFGGPITIARVAFHFAGDIYKFIVFLGIIGVNLAVVNFLPIPVLDGGHMVFLIYEKLRGKPMPEQVRFAATMVGVTFILGLMAMVLYLDVSRLIFW
jgi:regulator of sigma E protease